MRASVSEGSSLLFYAYRELYPGTYATTWVLSSALKHYTSKLSSFNDLSSLQTFGFRGEALSSLCALADFHVITAQADQVPKANRLDFEISGKLRKTQIVAGQKGTTASVEGIFKRLPVRRRELEKNIKREYGKVLNLLHAYACISTGVRFSVRNTVGRTKNVVVFSTNGNLTTKENIANVYGAKTLSALIPLDLELEFEPSAVSRRANKDEQLNQIQVRGHISRPVFGEGRQTPDRQMFFVNSRPCGLPQIAKAFNEVYKSFNVSQSPFVFADFRMDTNAYDVNVSPDKRTILLHDAGALVESLKESLVQLFENAEQTVPQSQVLGPRTPTTKQQALGSLPGFVSARQLSRSASETTTTPSRDQTVAESGDDESKDCQQAIQNKLRVSLGSPNDSSQAEAQSTLQRFTSMTQQPTELPSAPPSPKLNPEDTPLPSEDRRGDHRLESNNQPTLNIRPESSPQSPEPDPTPNSQSMELEGTPNVVQNAFDRMRPRRLPAEMATITIGGHTVKSLVGSGVPRKGTSDFGLSTRESSGRRRRIHTPSRPNIFGKHMQAFAAPGTQTQLSDVESEDAESEVEQVDPLEEEPEEVGDDEREHQSSAHTEDDDRIPEENHASPERPDIPASKEPTIEAATSDSQEMSLDEVAKKAQEDAVVQRLIHQAEETAVLPQEHSTSRANKMNKGASHRDATVHLVGTIDASISRLQAQMSQLRKCLLSQKEPFREEGADVSEAETAEERLSLTVSKADFARMRIIGQFNLGFIIAVRPGVNNDELFIIDQHASDEKFNFERLQAETVVQNQRLVRPQRLDLTAVEEEVVLENRIALEKNGFVVTIDESGDEPIGRRCQLVSLPLSKEVVFGLRDLEELIALLSDAPATSAVSVPRPSKVRKMFAMRACRSSIMIGKTLTTRQMQRVVQNMGTIDKPWNCPHGRPTMRHLMSLGQWKAYDEYGDYDSDSGSENEEENHELNIWQQYVEGDVGAEDENEGADS